MRSGWLGLVALAGLVRHEVAHAESLRANADLDRGLFVEDANHTFGVRAGILTQARYDAALRDGDLARSSFSLPAVRPQLRAYAFRPWLRLFVQPELGGTPPRLLDFEIDAQPKEWLGVKVGQFITPFSRQFLVPVPRLAMFDFAPANVAFRSDRDTGAMVYGYPLHGRLEYYLGAFDGNGINQNANDDARMEFVGRVAATPVGKTPTTAGHVTYSENPGLDQPVPFTLQLGANGFVNRLRHSHQALDAKTSALATVNDPTEDRSTVGADLAVAWGRFFVEVEAYERLSRAAATRHFASGGYAQASYALCKCLELSGRASVLRTDVHDARTEAREYDVQGTTYLAGHHAKAGLRVSAADGGGKLPAAQRGVLGGTLFAQLAF